jgi:hypothetical protein
MIGNCSGPVMSLAMAVVIAAEARATPTTGPTNGFRDWFLILVLEFDLGDLTARSTNDSKSTAIMPSRVTTRWRVRGKSAKSRCQTRE